MKKFKITWGKGSVCGINIVFKSITVESENIDSVNYSIILPEGLKKNVYYYRKIYTSDTKRNIDYGSYVNFIEVEEIW